MKPVAPVPAPTKQTTVYPMDIAVSLANDQMGNIRVWADPPNQTALNELLLALQQRPMAPVVVPAEPDPALLCLHEDLQRHEEFKTTALQLTSALMSALPADLVVALDNLREDETLLTAYAGLVRFLEVEQPAAPSASTQQQ